MDIEILHEDTGFCLTLDLYDAFFYNKISVGKIYKHQPTRKGDTIERR
jgi:hypothetical protein